MENDNSIDKLFAIKPFVSEWDPLFPNGFEEEIRPIEEKDNLFANVRYLIAYRNEHSNQWTGKISFLKDDSSDCKYLEEIEEMHIPNPEDLFGCHFFLHNFWGPDLMVRFDLNHKSIRNNQNMLDASIYNVSFIAHYSHLDKKKTTSILQEYYLNAFDGFPTNKERTVQIRTYKSVSTGDRPDLSLGDGTLCEEPYYTLRCLVLEYNQCTISIFSPPSEHCGRKEDALTIEYTGKIPSADNRKKIVTFLSFVFGKKLLICGESEMDSERRPITVKSYSPDNYELYSKIEPKPPFHLDRKFSYNKLNRALNEFMKTPLLDCWESIFDRYWESLSQHNLMGALMIQVIFETIRNSYFELPDSTNEVCNLKSYRALIKNEIKTIEEKLSNYPDKEYILNNIRNAPSKSSNRKTTEFVNKYDINVNDERKDAIKKCNAVRHGSTPDMDPYEMFNIYWSYINEVLCKILNFDVTIIDYNSSESNWNNYYDYNDIE